MSKYSIENIKSKYRNIYLAKTLPQLPMRALFIGRSGSGSGKSTVIFNLLLIKKFGIRKFFKPEDIYIFSPTYFMDDRYKFKRLKKIPEENIHLEYKESELKKIWDHYEELKQQSKRYRKHFLIIFDDLLGSLPASKSGFISKLYCSIRHINGSVITVVQQYNFGGCSALLRINSTNLLIWPQNEKVLQDIYFEHGGQLTKDEFFKIARHCWSKKYSFFHINYHNPPEERYICNFEKIVIPKK